MNKLSSSVLITSIIYILLNSQIIFAGIWEEKTVGLDGKYSTVINISSRNDTLFLMDGAILYYSTNLGDSWNVYTSCLLEPLSKDPSAGNKIITLNNSIIVLNVWNLLYRIDNSKQCEKILLDGKYKNGSLVDLAKNKKFVFAADYNKIYRSSDEGKTWRLTNYKDDNKLSCIAANDTAIFAISESSMHIYRSFDNGDNWEEVPFFNQGKDFYPDKLVIDNNILYAYARQQEYLFFSSSDYGTTWEPILKNTCYSEFGFSSNPPTWVEFDVKDDYIFLANMCSEQKNEPGHFTQVYGFSSNGGKNWNMVIFPEFDYLHSQAFVFKDYVFLVAYTYGGSTYRKLYRAKKTDLYNYATVINDGTKPELGIYPNPTQISINIPNDALINCTKYKIYDVYGRVISEGVINSQQIDVSHFPNGVYNIILTGTGKTLFQKFIKN